jgi:hypothetical protein
MMGTPKCPQKALGVHSCSERLCKFTILKIVKTLALAGKVRWDGGVLYTVLYTYKWQHKCIDIPRKRLRLDNQKLSHGLRAVHSSYAQEK